ncbi:CaiB/BaiF CoA-transferase family protein [Sphingomonas oligophenolica]|uniref:CoA transferase n=1 Tax=Sphingomonas oligophenolica TaxID=301154 RepID=A0ABU9Y946_9SPHN
MTALVGLTIVETAERVVGEYAARLLADFGAEVIKVEPPGGSPTRAMGPHVNGESVPFAYLNTNKKSVMLDLDAEAGRARLGALLARADAWIDDHDEDWRAGHALAPEAVAKAHPALVHCAITPFGQGAPEDRRRAYPINVINAGGWGYHTPSETASDKPPLKGAGRFLPDYEAGLDAAMAVAASLWRKRQTGAGQFIDMSEVETQLSRADVVLGRILAGDDEPSLSRTRYDMGGPATSFDCADGHVYLIMTTRAHWNGLRTLMGDPDWARQFPEDWLEFHCTPERVKAFRDQFRPWIVQQDKVRVSDEAQKLNVPIVPVNTAADLCVNAQYRHRGYFQPLEHPLLGKADYPTVPYRMSGSPARLTRPAPVLGEHADEVLV